MDEFEKIMAELAAIEELAPDDELSRLIGEYADDELCENELDLVSAAAAPDFDSFLKFIKK